LHMQLLRAALTNAAEHLSSTRSMNVYVYMYFRLSRFQSESHHQPSKCGRHMPPAFYRATISRRAACSI
jgi:hypothetical protein